MKTDIVIFFILLALSLAIGLPSCTKRQAADTPFNKIQGKWKLSKEATDDNGNNIIDPSEIHPVSVQQDNEITFNKDLTGVETNTYNGVVSPPLNFTWKIIDEDSSIECAYTGHDTIIYYLAGVTSGSLTLQTNTTKGIAWYYFNKD